MSFTKFYPHSWDEIQKEGITGVDSISSDKSIAAVNAVRERYGLSPVKGTDSLRTSMSELEAAILNKRRKS